MLDPFADWIRHFVIHQAYIAPFLLLFLEESGVPLPIPGDAYIAFVGYHVSLHQMPYWVAFLLLMTSVLAGSSILYYVSARWGNVLVLKLGKYLHINEKKLLMVEENFRKYGVWVIIVGRHIPGLRVPITIFSGISGIGYKKFIISTFLSVVFWVTFYLSLGDKLGKGVARSLHSNPLYYIFFIIPYVVFLCAIFYIRIHKKRSRKKAQEKSSINS